MSQGGRAAKSGSVLESTVEGTLRACGYVQISQLIPQKRRRDWLLHSNAPPKRYARQVYIGTGIYHTDIYVDFYLVGAERLPNGLIIECKWQQSSGSVDEKLPYLNLNIQHCYPAPAVVLIDGRGMKAGAIDWLTEQVALNSNLLAVHNLTSFMIWANANL